MTTYLIAQLQISDRERYARYEAGFLDIFGRYDGKLLSVDEQPTVLEGEWPWTRTVLLEFPSRERALAWYESEDYRALMTHRHAASEGNVVIIDGLPAAV